MSFERTLVVIKPDAVQNGVTDKIYNIFRANKLQISGIRKLTASREMVEDHLLVNPMDYKSFGSLILDSYKKRQVDLKDQTLFSMSAEQMGKLVHCKIVDYLTSGPLYASILQGEDAINRVINLRGKSIFPAEVDRNSIRGLFGNDSFETCIKENRIPYNVIHASDSEEEAEKEIPIWFPPTIYKL